MQSEAMIRKAAEAIWAIRREEEDRCDMSLDDMGGEESSVWHEAKAALEAALSTDAEPVFAVLEFAKGTPGRENEMPRVLSCNWLPDGLYNVYINPPAPSVLVNALEWAEETQYLEVWRSRPDCGLVFTVEDDGFSASKYRTSVGQKVIGYFTTLIEAKAAAQADYEARIRSALSAQVQDVAVPEAKPENKAEPDRSKFPYVWEGPKPDDAIIHKVINAYMGAQDREYDIGQFRYYKANRQRHYTLNQHMKEAVDACASPAPKHGEEG